MTPERELIHSVLRSLDPAVDCLFRINAGVGWTGSLVRRDNDCVILSRPRVLRAAPEGWPDLCGWRAHTVTEADVGRVLAVFRAVEIKAGRDRMRPAQQRFREVLESMGGEYEIVRE
jgi:hypothetical protein